jgi:hypothetical protein
VADGRPPRFGVPTDQRVVLVCTHGRKDVCCAKLGRPVAITPTTVALLAEAVQDRRVVPALLRGRAGQPAAVQAAEFHVRGRLGIHRLDGVVPGRHQAVGEDAVRVELLLDSGEQCVALVRRRGAAFDLVTLERGGRAPGFGAA